MSEIQPILLSAIVSNRVIFDKVSAMPSIIDILQTISTTKFPARHPQMVFFCELTNGHGTTKTAIKLVDNDDTIIFQQSGEVVFKDVKQILSITINLQGIVFPKPGEYRFQIFTNDQLLGERRIICQKIKPPAGKS